MGDVRDVGNAGADEARALDLLEHAKTVFATKGFDGASMQDLARGAGISAGNFYRYFPSKNALIEAIVEREIEDVRAKFAEVLGAADPLAAFRALVRQHIETGHADDGPIWVEIEAAATRRPEFAALLGRMEQEVARNLVAIFARISGLGEAEAAQRFTPHARAMLILVQSVVVTRCSPQGATSAPPDPGLAALVVRLIEHTLAEVVPVGLPARQTVSMS